MKTIKTLTILMLMLLMTAACSDRADLDGGGNGDTTSNGIVMTLQLPNFSKDKIGTRADGSVESLNSVYVVLYDENLNHVGDVQKITAAEFKNKSGNTFKVTIKATNNAKYIHVITNHEPTEAECADLTKCTLTGDPDTSNPVCWGYTTIDALLGGSDNVTLVRQYAKASVSVAEAYKDKFIISECKIVGAANNGSIAASANASVAPALHKKTTGLPTHRLPQTMQTRLIQPLYHQAMRVATSRWSFLRQCHARLISSFTPNTKLMKKLRRLLMVIIR